MNKKIGTLTFAVTLIVLGASALADKLLKTDLLGLVLGWWPVLLIVIGGEIIWQQAVMARDTAQRGWRLDGKSIVLLILVLLVAGAYHSARGLRAVWSADSLANVFNGIIHSGQSVPLKELTLPAASVDSLRIQNSIGQISVVGGDTPDIKLTATAWVQTADPAQAQKRAEQLDVQISGGSHASVVVADHGSAFGWGIGTPAVDLVLQVPSQLKVQVQSTVGSIQLSNLAEADVQSGTGAVTVQHIAGKASVQTTTGKMDVEDVHGAATLSATTGAVQAVQIGDNLDVKTATGHVSFRDAAKAVHVEATTGAVDGNLSGPIGGDYDLSCTTGAIVLTVPSESSASFSAQTFRGNISGSMPWSLQKESGSAHASASLGSSQYQVNLHTATGHIEVNTRQ